MRILLVEDEIMLAEATAQILKKNNYTVDLADNGEYGLDCGLSDIYDVIILDIMLPKLDGLSVLRELRKNGIHTPIILLTAKGGTRDKVTGLDLGADDYMAKPFQMDELLARLRAMSRRKGDVHNDGLYSFADISLNPNTLFLLRNESNVQLTLKESQLLEMLIIKTPMLTTKNSIIEKLWGYDADATDNNVETHISLLRKKLKNLGSSTSIEVIRGAGYLLTDGRRDG